MQQFAFVCGVPRSGTTAMVALLNAHPLVCLGMERFNSSLWDLSPTFFEKDRFFDFDPGRNHKLYRRMAEKWDSARLIGDKIPWLFKALPQVRERFPGAKLIYMLRDIEGVASSWNRRALDEADAWHQTFRAAVPLWNEANRVIARDGGDDILIVCYERFLSGDEAELARVCDFLGVEQHPNLTAVYWTQVERCRDSLRTRPAVVLPGQKAFIRRRADMRLYRALLRAGPIRWHHFLSQQAISERMANLFHRLYGRSMPMPER